MSSSRPIWSVRLVSPVAPSCLARLSPISGRYTSSSRRLRTNALMTFGVNSSSRSRFRSRPSSSLRFFWYARNVGTRSRRNARVLVSISSSRTVIRRSTTRGWAPSSPSTVADTAADESCLGRSHSSNATASGSSSAGSSSCVDTNADSQAAASWWRATRSSPKRAEVVVELAATTQCAAEPVDKCPRARAGHETERGRAKLLEQVLGSQRRVTGGQRELLDRRSQLLAQRSDGRHRTERLPRPCERTRAGRPCPAYVVRSPVGPEQLRQRPLGRRVPQQPGTGPQPQQHLEDRRGVVVVHASLVALVVPGLGRAAHHVEHVRVVRHPVGEHRRGQVLRAIDVRRLRHQQLVPERLRRLELLVPDNRAEVGARDGQRHLAVLRHQRQVDGLRVHREPVPAQPDRLTAVLSSLPNRSARSRSDRPASCRAAFSRPSSSSARTESSSPRRSSATDRTFATMGSDAKYVLISSTEDSAATRRLMLVRMRSAESTSRSALRACSSTSACLRDENAS